MTTNVHTAAGSKLYIGGTGDLASESNWTEVGEVVDFGEFGKTFNLVSHNPVGDRQTYKFKGSHNSGNLALQLGQDASDAGQAIMITALASDTAYNIKVELNDASTDSGATPTTFTFKGLIMSYTTKIGTVDNIVGASATVEISGSITRVAAT